VLLVEVDLGAVLRAVDPAAGFPHGTADQVLDHGDEIGAAILGGAALKGGRG
jgi:hypothetical protein